VNDIRDNFVEHFHPEFGQGFFCTADVLDALASHTGEAEPVAERPWPKKATPEMIAAFKLHFKEGSMWTDRLTRAIKAMLEATPPAATPAAPGEVFATTMRNIFGNEFPTHPNSAGEYPGWSDHWAIFQAGAALSHPAPVAAPAQPLGYLDALGLRLFAGSASDHTITLRRAPKDGDVPIYSAAPAPASEAVALNDDLIDQACERHSIALRAGLTSRKAMKRAIEIFLSGDSADAPVQQAGEITDAMVDAYLAAQRQTVEEADKFGRPNVGGLHTNTVREACRNGLRAALKGEQPEPSGSERGEV